MKFFPLSLLLFWSSFAFSQQNIPDPPSPARLVVDQAEILSPQEEAQLESKLVALDDTTGNQIVVLTVPELHGYDPFSFGHAVFEKWGVGQKDRENGVLVLVKPKTPDSKGELFIVVGYGLEGAIPDAIANRISDLEMIPYFKNNDYYGGINKGVEILSSLAAGEFSAAEYQGRAKKDERFSISPILVIIIVIIIMSFFRRGKKRHKSIGHNMGSLAWLLLASQMGRRHGGSWGDFSGGRGSFGGGGFGGFGGGRSGGGGAGGSW